MVGGGEKGGRAGTMVATTSNSERRILLVTPHFPYPDWGFTRRVFQLAAELGSKYNVTLLTYSHDDDPSQVDEMSRYVANVVCIPGLPRAHERRRIRQAVSLASVTPFHAGHFRPYGMQAALDHLVELTTFDLIQIESSQLGWLRTPSGVPVVLDEHNIESEVLARTAAAETEVLRRGFNRYEAWRYRRYEKRLWTRAQGVITTSRRDADVVAQAAPTTKVRVVPNGVDVSAFQPADHEHSDVIVFTGLLGYRPNVDGVRWFISEVLPLIRNRRPSARLTVVGASTPEVVESLRAPGAEFLGWVPDVRPHLSAATVVVVPLLAGGGTRLKVVEALSCGRAIVSTSLGAEGIDVTDEVHLLIRDTPNEFAEAVLALMNDPAARRRLGRRARELAAERYSWTQSASAMEDLHDDVLGICRADASVHGEEIDP